jgi:hypothetical protein
MKNDQYRGVRTEIELSCPAETSELRTCRTHQRCHEVLFPKFPSECITQVVTATTGQIVDQNSPNLCAIPNIHSNACKVFVGEVSDGIRSRGLLMPVISLVP